MTVGRPAIIAVQAIVVGVLVVVVYLTLLRPEDEGTLSGVDAPGGTQITQQPVPGADRRDGRGENGAGAGDDSEGGAQVVGSAFVPGTAGTAVGALPVAPVAPSTPESQPDGSEDEPDEPEGGPDGPGGGADGPGGGPDGAENEPDEPEGGPDGPDSDQYNDALARLTEQLN
jgi:hypothetical protein